MSDRTALDDVVAATAAGRLLPEVRRCLLRVESRQLPGGWGRAATTHPGDAVAPDPHAAFRIASVTKMATAATLLALVDEQRCGLDDPIGRHLPGDLVERVHCLGGRSYGHRITLRRLLDHTSGLPDYFPLPAVQAAIRAGDGLRRFSPRTLVDLAAAGNQPGFRPGEGGAYTDTGFVLAGLVIEAVTQAPLQDAYRRYVFVPAGMPATWLESGTEPARRAPILPHDLDGEDISALDPTVDWAGGGLVSTAGDLVSFLRGLIAGRLVSAESWDQMTRWSPGPLGYYDEYGLGLGRYTFGEIHLVGHHACGWPESGAGAPDGSGTLDFEPATDCRGDPLQAVGVGADDEIVAAQRSFNHAGVDDVRRSGPGRQRPDRPRPVIVEGLDVAADEQPGQQRLAAASPPALRHNGCGTVGSSRNASSDRCRAHIRRSPRSAATRAPVSYRTGWPWPAGRCGWLHCNALG